MGKKLNISNEPYSNQTEMFRIKGNKIDFGVVTFEGKEGDVFIVYTPSLEISGYGNTKEEAKKSFDFNISQFCEDLYLLNTKNRDTLLTDLGWSKVKYKNKNYSKAYIDNEGVLKNFDKGTVERKFLEAAA